MLTRTVVVAVMGSLAGCAFFSPAAPHKPVGFESAAPAAGGAAFPNWPLPPDEVQAKVVGHAPGVDFQVTSVKGAGAGTTGALKEVVHFPDIDEEVRFKVKPVPGRLDGVNNSPRKELAAYAIQQLFLDPEDFVVPTTFILCIPIDVWEDHHGIREKPTLEGSDCILIVAAVWLQNLTIPDPVYDEERFLRDPVYAYYLSNLNVLTYVVGHRDGRKGNFLVSQDEKRPQYFAIDNGSTFNPWGYNYFVANWDVLRVASVRKTTVDRLRKLERSDLDPLLVVAQLELGSDETFHNTEPGPAIDLDEGVSRRGGMIQFGLTRKELDKVWDRIQRLIAQVDDGSLPVF